MDAKAVHHVCIQCGARYPHTLTTKCGKCGGLVDVTYDYDQISGLGSAWSDDPVADWWPLLPIQNPDNLLNLGRFKTPVIHARTLGKLVGLENLFLKDETQTPTRSTKDRMAAVSLAFLKEVGIKEFVITSTGNSSTAYAYGVSRQPEFRLHVFVGRGWADRVQYAEHPDIFVHHVDTDFVGTGQLAQDFAKQHNLCWEGGFFNPARREGLKLTVLEAYEQLGWVPDWYFQAVSSAMGVYGAHKGYTELQRIGLSDKAPRMVCAQQETCAPMYHAFRENSPVILPHHKVANPQGIAQAILRGDPSGSYPYIYKLVKGSDGTIEAVSATEIREAQSMLFELEGIRACEAGSASVATVVKMAKQGRLLRTARILVNVTGGIRSTSPDPLAVAGAEQR